MKIMVEIIRGLKGLTLKSTINNSAYYNSEEDDVERDQKSNQLVATHTTNINYPQNLLINRFIPEIIPVVIPPIDPLIVDGVAASSGNSHAHQIIISEEIVMDAARVFSNILQ